MLVPVSIPLHPFPFRYTLQGEREMAWAIFRNDIQAFCRQYRVKPDAETRRLFWQRARMLAFGNYHATTRH